MMTKPLSGRGPSIATYTGKVFNLEEPEFDTLDIAHALSNTCRYAGHCNRFYSVAEHSVLVSHLMEHLELGDPFVGLMHDGHEAYFSDVPAPFKPLMPEWQALDEALEKKLYSHYNIPFPRESGCKEADIMALFIEKDALWDRENSKTFSQTKHPELYDRAMLLAKAGWGVQCWAPTEGREEFLKRYDQLQKQTGTD